MAKYFAGNTLASFFRSSTTVVDGLTTASWFDSAYVPSCINVPGGSSSPSYIETPPFAATGTIWWAFELRSETLSTNQCWPMISYNGATNAYRLSVNTSGYMLEYWNGSAWIAGTRVASTVPSTARVRIVVKVVMNSEMRVYVGGTELGAAAITGITTGQTGVTRTQFTTVNSTSGNCGFSQIMIADYDIRDSRFMAAALTGDSAANTDGTGAFTAINETVLDESTAVSLLTTAHKRGQTHAAITVPAGYVIGAAVFNARGRASGTITDGKLGFRSGGTNYSSSGKAYNAGYEPRSHVLENDPATATRFTQAGFNAAETYLEAV